jgi:hypothetical protein
MPAPLTVGLAPNVVLRGGYVLRVTALNPTTGAVVSGVVVSDVALQVDAFEPEPEPPKVEKFVPLFTYGGT